MLAGYRIRLVLLVLVGILAAALGFVLVPPAAALTFVQHQGYYVILTAFLLFVAALVRLWRQSRRAAWWSPADWRLAILCLAVTVIWQLHGPRGFKILMDEYVVSATAMDMHFEREVFVPLKTHDVNGIYQTLGGIVDKRPLFFPLLLSLVHDFTGYRSGNVFVLNAVLSFVLLFLTGRLARKFGTSENAGLLAVVLLAGLPLLASNSTGAAFEVLNLVMIVAVGGLACRYAARPDDVSLDAFVLGGVLLAQTRYESAVYISAVGAIILWGWWRARRPVVSWGLVATPLLLILVPLLNKIFTLNKGFWQVRDNADAPFGLQHVTNNLGHAVDFLFVVDGFQLGSPVLAASGLVCLIFFLLFVVRRWRAASEDGVLVVFAALTLATMANFFLVLCYHWGQLDDFVASRLGLPLLLLFALAAAFSLGRWVKRDWVWWPVLGVPAAWALLGSLPIHARSQSNMTFLTYREVEWQAEFVRAHRDRDCFFVLPSPLPAIVERQPAMAVAVLEERAKEMAYHLAEKTYHDIFVFQRFEIDPVTHVERAAELSVLGPEFILETIEERRIKPLEVTRVSRLVAVDLSRQPPRPPDWKPGFPPFEIKIPENRHSPEDEYLRVFLRDLP